MFNRTQLVFIFLILFSSLVSGLGVSPGIVEIEFKPGLTTSFDMTVYNTPVLKERYVEIYVSYAELDDNVVDEFKDTIVPEQKTLHFSEQETTKTLKININLPQGFSIPGTHELRVGAIQTTAGGQEGLSIVAGNEIRVLINVSEEYVSNKYAKIKKLKILNVYAEDVPVGGKSNIGVLVKSESDVSLQNVYGKIKVLQEGQEIKTLETNKINLEPGQEEILETEFEAKRVKAGILILDVEVFYDGKLEKAQGTLRVLEAGAGATSELPYSGFRWWWILVIILLIIIIVLFILLLRKRREDPEQIKQ